MDPVLNEYYTGLNLSLFPIFAIAGLLLLFFILSYFSDSRQDITEDRLMDSLCCNDALIAAHYADVLHQSEVRSDILALDYSFMQDMAIANQGFNPNSKIISWKKNCYMVEAFLQAMWQGAQILRRPLTRSEINFLIIDTRAIRKQEVNDAVCLISRFFCRKAWRINGRLQDIMRSKQEQHLAQEQEKRRLQMEEDMKVARAKEEEAQRIEEARKAEKERLKLDRIERMKTALADRDSKAPPVNIKTINQIRKEREDAQRQRENATLNQSAFALIREKKSKNNLLEKTATEVVNSYKNLHDEVETHIAKVNQATSAVLPEHGVSVTKMKADIEGTGSLIFTSANKHENNRNAAFLQQAQLQLQESENSKKKNTDTEIDKLLSSAKSFVKQPEASHGMAPRNDFDDEDDDWNSAATSQNAPNRRSEPSSPIVTKSTTQKNKNLNVDDDDDDGGSDDATGPLFGRKSNKKVHPSFDKKEMINPNNNRRNEEIGEGCLFPGMGKAFRYAIKLEWITVTEKYNEELSDLVLVDVEEENIKAAQKLIANRDYERRFVDQKKLEMKKNYELMKQEKEIWRAARKTKRLTNQASSKDLKANNSKTEQHNDETKAENGEKIENSPQTKKKNGLNEFNSQTPPASVVDDEEFPVSEPDYNEPIGDLGFGLQKFQSDSISVVKVEVEAARKVAAAREAAMQRVKKSAAKNDRTQDNEDEDLEEKNEENEENDENEMIENPEIEDDVHSIDSREDTTGDGWGISKVKEGDWIACIVERLDSDNLVIRVDKRHVSAIKSLTGGHNWLSIPLRTVKHNKIEYRDITTNSSFIQLHTGSSNSTAHRFARDIILQLHVPRAGSLVPRIYERFQREESRLNPMSLHCRFTRRKQDIRRKIFYIQHAKFDSRLLRNKSIWRRGEAQFRAMQQYTPFDPSAAPPLVLKAPLITLSFPFTEAEEANEIQMACDLEKRDQKRVADLANHVLSRPRRLCFRNPKVGNLLATAKFPSFLTIAFRLFIRTTSMSAFWTLSSRALVKTFRNFATELFGVGLLSLVANCNFLGSTVVEPEGYIIPSSGEPQTFIEGQKSLGGNVIVSFAEGTALEPIVTYNSEYVTGEVTGVLYGIPRIAISLNCLLAAVVGVGAALLAKMLFPQFIFRRRAPTLDELPAMLLTGFDERKMDEATKSFESRESVWSIRAGMIADGSILKKQGRDSKITIYKVKTLLTLFVSTGFGVCGIALYVVSCAINVFDLSKLINGDGNRVALLDWELYSDVLMAGAFFLFGSLIILPFLQCLFTANRIRMALLNPLQNLSILGNEWAEILETVIPQNPDLGFVLKNTGVGEGSFEEGASNSVDTDEDHYKYWVRVDDLIAGADSPLTYLLSQRSLLKKKISQKIKQYKAIQQQQLKARRNLISKSVAATAIAQT